MRYAICVENVEFAFNPWNWFLNKFIFMHLKFSLIFRPYKNNCYKIYFFSKDVGSTLVQLSLSFNL